LKIVRDDYDLVSRIKEEKKYHILTKNNPNTSFVYSAIVGYHKMADPYVYPGYIYYFQLTKNQIDKCLFGIVANKNNYIEPDIGFENLEKCINIWKTYNNTYKAYIQKEIGLIQPRIEFIIPFQIKPKFYIDQVEDR
jgi:hypothetical protein